MLDSIRQNASNWGVKALFGVIVLVFVFWGVGSFRGNQTQILAYVNDQPIYETEFVKSYQQQVERLRQEQPSLKAEDLKRMDLKAQVFNSLANRILLEQEVQKLGVEVSPAELRFAIASIPSFQNEQSKFDPGLYQRILASQGITPAGFEADIEANIAMGKLEGFASKAARTSDFEARSLFNYTREQTVVDYLLVPWSDFSERFGPTEEAIAAFYEENKESFKIPPRLRISYMKFTPAALAQAMKVSDEDIQTFYDVNAERYFTQEEQVKARHILIKVPEDATEEDIAEAEERIAAIRARIEAGEDFAEVAAEISEGPTNVKGGDLGWFTRGQMVEPFEKAAFSLRPGELSEPVRTVFGLHLIKVEDYEDTHLKPLGEVKDTIRSMLAEEKASEKLTDMLDQALEQIITGDELDVIAASMNLELQTSDQFSKVSGPSALGLSSKAVNELFLMEQGQTTDFPMSIDNGYMLAKIEEKLASEYQQLDEVREAIVKELQRIEGMKMAKAKAEELLDVLKESGPAALPEDYADNILASEPFTRSESVPSLGNNPELVKAAFAAEPGQWLDSVFQANRGYVAVQTVEHIPADAEEWEQARSTWVRSLSQMHQEELINAYVQTLRSASAIEIVNPDALQY